MGDISEVKEHLKKNILSLLFILFGVELLFYSVIRQFNIICSIIVAMLSIGFFIIFGKVVSLKKKGPILYGIVLLVCVALTFLFTSFGGGRVGFFFWLKNGGFDISINIPYLLGAIIIVPFAFTSLTYYFTVNMFRMPMVVLMYFIVMILYVKGIYDARNIIPTILSLLLISLLSYKGKSKEEEDFEDNREFKYKAFSVLSVVVVVFLIASIIPSSLKFPKNAFLENIKLNVLGLVADDSGDSSEGSDTFVVGNSTSRVINNSISMPSSKVIYTFEGDNPAYLINGAYDEYSNNKWTCSGKDYNFSYDMDANVNFLKVTKSIINNSTSNNEFINKSKSFKDVSLENNITLENKNVLALQLLHPANIRSASVNGFRDAEISIDQHNKLTNTYSRYFPLNQRYVVSYNMDNPSEGSMEDFLMRNLDFYTIIAMYKAEKKPLFDYYYSVVDKYDEKSIYNYDELVSLYSECNEEVKEQYTNLNYNTSDEIYALAQELTKDCTSYYDKAKAIEDYFQSGEYTYSLELPEDKSFTGDYMDYFIFTGKTGYCVQYATAMTLLCRAAGVPARYVEGYSVADSKERDGVYEVTEQQGHAFVQVFIPGYGWKIFEPTPGTFAENAGENEGSSRKFNFLSNININIEPKMLAMIIFVVIVILGVIYGLNKITKRPRFLNKVKKLSKGNDKEYLQAIELLIKDIIKGFEFYDITLYPGETLLNFAIRVDRELNVNFKEIVEEYYKVKYDKDNENPRVINFEEVLLLNKSIYKRK